MIIMAIARCRNRRREVNKKALLEQKKKVRGGSGAFTEFI